MIKIADDEKIIAVVRKHWFLPAINITNVGILFLLPIALVLFLLYFAETELLTPINQFIAKDGLILFLISTWGLMLWLSFFSFWTDHQLDGWVITSKRIMDVEQRGFFKREVASFRLERIQDVTTEIDGFFATLLNFGEVHVQTAGVDREFILKDAPDPKSVRKLIINQHDTTIESEPFAGKNTDAVGSNK